MVTEILGVLVMNSRAVVAGVFAERREGEHREGEDKAGGSWFHRICPRRNCGSQYAEGWEDEPSGVRARALRGCASPPRVLDADPTIDVGHELAGSAFKSDERRHPVLRRTGVIGTATALYIDSARIPFDDGVCESGLRLYARTELRISYRCMPRYVAGEALLVLDDHKPALLVQRQQIEAFAPIREAVELLLDDQELFARRIGQGRGQRACGPMSGACARSSATMRSGPPTS